MDKKVHMTAEIVIAEDDETIREVVDFKMAEKGWDEIVFRDGDECWEHRESRAND